MLPFTVRIAQTKQDIDQAVQVRHDAYNRHLPGLAAKLMEAEEADFSPDCAVLLAESLLDRAPLGTLRIHCNRQNPLPLERSVMLPEAMRGETLAEAVRLGIVQARIGMQVKVALFKAYYLFCVANKVDRMVIAGRKPMDRQYAHLLFSDVFGQDEFIPMAHAADIPHRVMQLKVADIQPLWSRARHSLYRFFYEESHPDIAIGPRRPLGLPRDILDTQEKDLIVTA